MNGSPSVSIAELLVRTATGDRVAFRSLYSAAGPKLFALTLRMMKSRDLAEDVLQEAFVKIWERSWQFDPLKGNGLAWLATLTRHCALDRLRRQPRGQVDFDGAIIEEIDSGHHLQGRAGEARDLYHCLGGLRDDYRNAVVMAYVNGLTHEELAVQLSKPVGTVKSWVRRSLQSLRRCLEA